MDKNNNVKCIVCGNGYHLCRSCKDKLSIAPYKILTDTSEHYKVYQVINAYRGGIYTKDEAKEVLSKIDISDKEMYLDSVKKILNEILEDKNTKRFNKISTSKRYMPKADIVEKTPDLAKSDKVETISVVENKVDDKADDTVN